jgi:hypothetical protein
VGEGDRNGATVVAANASAAATPAPSDAVVFDASTAKIVSNDEYGSTLRDANGVFQTKTSLVPVQVERDGAWIPASNVVTQADREVVAEDHPLTPTFPAVLGDSPIVSVDARGHKITFTLDGQSDGVAAKVESATDSQGDSKVTYPNAVAGADAVYDVVAGSVKENFVVHDKPSEKLQFSWVIDAPGLTLVRNEFGGVNMVAGDGEVVAHVPPPAMWDSAGEPDMVGADLVNVPFDFASLGDGRFRFTLTPDQEWLSAKERQYPVYVDPSVASDSVVAYKFSGATYGAVRIGNPAESAGWTAWRSVAHYPYEDIYNKYNSRIMSVSLASTKIYGTSNCYDGGLWTVAAYSYAGIGNYLAPFPNCATGDASSDLLSNYFANLVANRVSGVYLMLAGDEGYAYSYKQLTTTMTFTYVNAAVTTGVTGLSPRKLAVSDPMPQVHADDVVIEPVGTYYAGSAQLYRYTFTPAIPTTTIVPWTSQWVASGPYRVPDSVLTPGVDYSYKIETMDNYAYVSPVTTNTGGELWKFHTQGSPDTPTAITVDGQPLTADVTSSVERPTLAATVNVPAMGEVWTLFTVKQDGIVIMDSVAGSKVIALPAVGTGVSRVTLPYAMTAGAHYTVEVKAFDGHLASGVATSDPHWFTGPPRSIREIPGNNDGDTEATS